MFYSKKFKKFDKIKHCFFSRKGGFSKGLYKGLNCGRGSKDNTRDVLKNLEFVSQKMRVKKKNLVLMHQTHSNRVIEINKKTKLNSQVTFDGANNLTIESPDKIVIKKARRQLMIVHPCDYDYFSALAKKLKYEIKS